MFRVVVAFPFSSIASTGVDGRGPGPGVCSGGLRFRALAGAGMAEAPARLLAILFAVAYVQLICG